MVIIELTYKKPLDTVEQHLLAHRDFLTSFYTEGMFIASGPKVPRDGGIILAQTTKDKAQEIIKQDPFYINGITDYKIIEFTPSRYNWPVSN
ncbi:MAG: YciI family protein [Pseudomonadota bacterium]